MARAKQVMRTGIVVSAFGALLMGQVADAKVTIHFWHNWSGAGGLVMAGLADHFNKSQKDVVVKVTQAGDTYQKLLVATAAGQAPDVVVLDRYLTSQYAAKNILLKLDSYMKTSNMKSSMFYNAAIEEATFKGALYSIPMTVDSRTMWYNKNLLEKAGLDSTKVPTSWDGLRVYAEKLTQRDSSGKLTQVGFGPFWDQGGVLIQWLWQNDANVFDKDFNKVTFNSPEAISALKWGLDLEDYYGKGYSSFAGGSGGFYKQRVAFDMNGPWMQSDLIKNGPKDWLNWMRFAPVPYFKKPAVLIGGMGLVIPQLSKHKTEAWDFLRYVVSQEQQIYFGTSNGTIPALRSAANSKDYKNDPFRIAHVDEMEVTKARPAHPAYPDVEGLMGQAFGQAQSKKKSLEQAMAGVIKAAQTVLDTQNKRIKK